MPSREMVLRLAEHLDIPPRGRNELLRTAGFAAIFRDRGLSDPVLANARAVVDHDLRGHEPYPALAIAQNWVLIEANAAVPPLISGVDPALMEPPVNVLRVSLHPRGLAPLIVNLVEWRSLLGRLRRQLRLTRDRAIKARLEELSGYSSDVAPLGELSKRSIQGYRHKDIAVPLRIRTHSGVLSFLSTVTVFGTPVEIALSELSIEAFFPADQERAAALGSFCHHPGLPASASAARW